MHRRIDFNSLTRRLSRTSSRATASRLGFAHKGLRNWVRDSLGQSAGSDNSLLAEPVFEGTFGWESSGKTWSELAPKLISNELLEAIANNETNSINRDWDVYSHQLSAFQTLLGDDVKSVVVSSGTGSGKTECFLIPVLESLVRQASQSKSGIVGVQALFLYPLNALINSQQERLSAWTSPFNGKLRYCLYNGETPESAREENKEQVRSRRELRNNPPPILFTNPSMLEYMLVRREDAPILEGSQGKLKWIILDEAHTYIGSQAAELALLLRRVMIAFGVTSKNVRFVATSATIGDGERESIGRLREFLADVAGVDKEQVIFIGGQRFVPPLENEVKVQDTIEPDSGPEASKAYTDLIKALMENASDTAECYKIASTSPLAVRVREAVADAPQPVSRISKLLGVDNRHDESISLLGQLSSAVSDEGQPFLPLRMHLFHKTLPGLWVCINSECIGTKPGNSKNTWNWGGVSLRESDLCEHCGSLALELVLCSSCGAEYLKCDELYDGMQPNSHLVNRLPDERIDEFRLNVADEWEGGESEADDQLVDDEQSFTGNLGVGRLPRYLARTYLSEDNLLSAEIAPNGEILSDNGPFHLLEPEGNHFRCPCCGQAQTVRRSEFEVFRPARMGMPFYSTPVVQSLLQETPSAFSEPGKPVPKLPMEGRRVITFTDSRQGTARLSIAQQLDADRNCVRSHLYHQLLQRRAAASSDDLSKKLETEISALEEQADNPVIAGLIEERRTQLLTMRSSENIAAATWKDMVTGLSQVKELSEWSLAKWRETTFLNDVQASEYANYCLYRELMRRPKRATTLETLGLLGIRYPAISKLTSVPVDVASKGVSLEEWRHLLTLAITFTFRSSVAVDLKDSWQRWMGAPVYRTVIRGPKQDRRERTRHWPSVEYPRSILINTLLRSLSLDLSNAENRQWMAYVLNEVWSTLRICMGSDIQDVGDGYQLLLADAAELYLPNSVWICPYTQLAFDSTLRGISPYGPKYEVGEDGRTAKCREFSVPSAPEAYWRQPDSSLIDAEQWLESNEDVAKLRSEFLWDNRSDQIVAVSPWMAVGEHSAQQNSAKLSTLESRFKSGNINILNCSTTMEMGVDIGGISAVMMNNAPPAPANYLQRSGRAGRRGETAAVSLTLCGNSAHGALIFNNPTWPFTTPIAVPTVSLSSNEIVQRHVNALLLSIFIKDSGEANQMKAQSGWFFGFDPDSTGNWIQPSPCEKFMAWLQLHTKIVDAYGDELKMLLKGTLLASSSLSAVIEACEDSIVRVQKKWIDEVEALLAQSRYLSDQLGAGSKTPAIRSLQFQLNRTTKEYLLRDLATSAFLPGYGFPTSVVSFINTTVEDLKARDRSQTREDNRLLAKGFPSRDLSVAMREYAPGADIALDGRVYRSGGVTLNWHIPAGEGHQREEQNLASHWYCKSCGGGAVSMGARPEQCSACGSDELIVERVLQPAGFAVDISYQPHNDLSATRYIPVSPARLYINDAPWVYLPVSDAGRFRYSSGGIVLHRSAGRSNCGYSLCLMCGRAEEQKHRDELAAVFNNKAHTRLRGGKESDGSSECFSNSEQYTIQKNVILAHQTQTSVFELQLNDPVSGMAIQDESLAWTLAFSLKQGLLLALGLEANEISVGVQEARSLSGGSMQSIFLFDNLSGGAGYVEYLMSNLATVVGHARDILDCPNACGTACHSCILSYETQFSANQLNRKIALELIDSGLIDRLALPAPLRYFGGCSMYEPMELTHAVALEVNKASKRDVYLLLAGDADEWNIKEFELLGVLLKWANDGHSVILVLHENILEELSQDEARSLATISSYPGISVRETSLGFILNSTGELRVAVSHDDGQLMAWATDTKTVRAPGNGWEFNDSVVVRGLLKRTLLDDHLRQIEFESLTSSTSAGQHRLAIDTELNGSITDFGREFWGLINSAAPQLMKMMIVKGRANKITYSDRYLKNPLTMRLLQEYLRFLPDEVIGENTKLFVKTRLLEDKRYSNVSRRPQWLSDNWQTDRVRRNVFVSSMNSWWSGECDLGEYRDLPHHREILIEWLDGSYWTMQLDGGFGCWRTVKSHSYPFHLGIKEQAEALQRDDTIAIENRNTKLRNYFFIDTSVNKT